MTNPQIPELPAVITREPTLTADFDFVLPKEAIAQSPCQRRDESRLMGLDRSAGEVSHHRFSDLPSLLCAGDLLVVNNSLVSPWRLYGRRTTGGRVEALILSNPAGATPCAMLKSKARLREGERLVFENRVEVDLVRRLGGGRWEISFSGDEPADQVIEEVGRAPLPPYIARSGTESTAVRDEDRERYQTVYASRPGSVAAPTAGLHFTDDLLLRLQERGIERVEVTLHVGPGTFLPIKTEWIQDHRMEEERFSIDGDSLTRIRKARADGRRVIAVGSTACRTLETLALAADHEFDVDGVRFGVGSSGQATVARVDAGLPGERIVGSTSLFLHAPYRFRWVDGMITNFHLPKSTLILLVSAFAGRERILAAYREALERGYRFYSFGDAMLIGERRR